VIRHKFQRHLLRPSVIRALPQNLATEAKETWGKIPAAPHQNAQEATSKPATCILYAWTLHRSALTLTLFESPFHPPQMHTDLHEIAHRISHRTQPRGRQPGLALFSFMRKRRRYRCLDKIAWGVIQISYQEYGEVVGVVFCFAMSPFPSVSMLVFHLHIHSHSLPVQSFRGPFCWLW